MAISSLAGITAAGERGPGSSRGELRTCRTPQSALRRGAAAAARTPRRALLGAARRQQQQLTCASVVTRRARGVHISVVSTRRRLLSRHGKHLARSWYLEWEKCGGRIPSSQWLVTQRRWFCYPRTTRPTPWPSRRWTAWRRTKKVENIHCSVFSVHSQSSSTKN